MISPRSATPAARLALANTIGSGVRLEASEVARLLEQFPAIKKAGDVDLRAGRESELAAAAQRKAERRAARKPAAAAELPAPSSTPPPICHSQHPSDSARRCHLAAGHLGHHEDGKTWLRASPLTPAEDWSLSKAAGVPATDEQSTPLAAPVTVPGQSRDQLRHWNGQPAGVPETAGAVDDRAPEHDVPGFHGMEGSDEKPAPAAGGGS